MTHLFEPNQKARTRMYAEIPLHKREASAVPKTLKTVSRNSFVFSRAGDVRNVFIYRI